jgi:hypothetical protein
MAKKEVDTDGGGSWTPNRVIEAVKETKVGTRIAVAVMVLVLIAVLTS